MHCWHHVASVKSVANILTDPFWKGLDWQKKMKGEAAISAKMMCAFLLFKNLTFLCVTRPCVVRTANSRHVDKFQLFDTNN